MSTSSQREADAAFMKQRAWQWLERDKRPRSQSNQANSVKSTPITSPTVSTFSHKSKESGNPFEDCVRPSHTDQKENMALPRGDGPLLRGTAEQLEVARAMSKTKSFDERRGLTRRSAGSSIHTLPVLRPVQPVSHAPLKQSTGINDKWHHDLYQSRDDHHDSRPALSPGNRPATTVTHPTPSVSGSSPLKPRADSPVDMAIPPHLRSRQTSAMSVDEVEPAKEAARATQKNAPPVDSPLRRDSVTTQVEPKNGLPIVQSPSFQDNSSKQADVAQATSNVEAAVSNTPSASQSHQPSAEAASSDSVALQDLTAKYNALCAKCDKLEAAFASVNETCSTMQKENEQYQFVLDEKFEALFLAEERRQLSGTRHAPFDVWVTYQGERLRVQAHRALKIAALARRAAITHRLRARESLSARIFSKGHEKLDDNATLEECGLAADAEVLYVKEESRSK